MVEKDRTIASVAASYDLDDTPHPPIVTDVDRRDGWDVLVRAKPSKHTRMAVRVPMVITRLATKR